MSKNIVNIGIDFGGTTIHGGLVAGKEILHQATAATGNDRAAEAIFETIAGIIEQLVADVSVHGVGIGVPVPAGLGSDEIRDAVNIPSMEGYPLKTKLEERFGIPVTLENDARCMVLGEYTAGALQGCGNAVCLTLGTGLGCGIMIGGHVYRGETLWGGEIWNIPYGGSGMSFEEVSSIRGLKKLYRELGGEDIEPDGIHARFLSGESTARLAFEQYGKIVGSICATVFCLLDPAKIAIGGGLSRAWDAFAPAMKELVGKTVGARAEKRIVPALLSEDAAIIGAASLCTRTDAEECE